MPGPLKLLWSESMTTTIKTTPPWTMNGSIKPKHKLWQCCTWKGNIMVYNKHFFVKCICVLGKRIWHFTFDSLLLSGPSGGNLLSQCIDYGETVSVETVEKVRGLHLLSTVQIVWKTSLGLHNTAAIEYPKQRWKYTIFFAHVIHVDFCNYHMFHNIQLGLW